MEKLEPRPPLTWTFWYHVKSPIVSTQKFKILENGLNNIYIYIYRANTPLTPHVWSCFAHQETNRSKNKVNQDPQKEKQKNIVRTDKDNGDNNNFNYCAICKTIGETGTIWYLQKLQL